MVSQFGILIFLSPGDIKQKVRSEDKSFST